MAESAAAFVFSDASVEVYGDKERREEEKKKREKSNAELEKEKREEEKRAKKLKKKETKKAERYERLGKVDAAAVAAAAAAAAAAAEAKRAFAKSLGRLDDSGLGEAGMGRLMIHRDGTIKVQGEYIRDVKVNEAEGISMARGVRSALEKEWNPVEVRCDSSCSIKTVQVLKDKRLGINTNIEPCRTVAMFDYFKVLEEEVGEKEVLVSYEHVDRELNGGADLVSDLILSERLERILETEEWSTWLPQDKAGLFRVRIKSAQAVIAQWNQAQVM